MLYLVLNDIVSSYDTSRQTDRIGQSSGADLKGMQSVNEKQLEIGTPSAVSCPHAAKGEWFASRGVVVCSQGKWR